MTAVDWARYRKCRVCFAGTGDPCLRRIEVRLGVTRHVPAEEPHRSRQLRTGGA